MDLVRVDGLVDEPTGHMGVNRHRPFNSDEQLCHPQKSA